MDEPEFEITYSIKRNGEEIGFGGILADTLRDACHFVDTALQCGEWETEPGMPDPRVVLKEEDQRRWGGDQ
ncbi:hypothetical protein [Hoyosella altamirensis]|uniref:hypothetical protein n=1 Tax=Hoyosella altamirensis TaxID=616997 RepID=UPI0007DB1631|nr:hypothetical protein [Hoyosella altamirensis]